MDDPGDRIGFGSLALRSVGERRKNQRGCESGVDLCGPIEVTNTLIYSKLHEERQSLYVGGELGGVLLPRHYRGRSWTNGDAG